jgi:hypothetical protein
VSRKIEVVLAPPWWWMQTTFDSMGLGTLWQATPGRLWLLAAVAIFPTVARAQEISWEPRNVAPFVGPDHSLTPIIEHLIARGVVDDPSPMVRPWGRARLVEAVEAARPRSGRDTVMVDGVRKALQARSRYSGESLGDRWSIQGSLGRSAWTHGRRDPMQPEGREGGSLWGRVDAALTMGSLGVAASLEADGRLLEDPDWQGRPIARTKGMGFRYPSSYLSVGGDMTGFVLGTIDRHWGVQGAPGLALGVRAYPRPGWALSLGGRELQWSGVVYPLPPEEYGREPFLERTFAAHRIRWSPIPSLDLAVWETLLFARQGQSAAEVWERLAGMMTFATQFGRRADNNTILGVDIAWRPKRGLHMELQFAGDDIRAHPDRPGDVSRPDRWAWAAGLRGAGWGSSTWIFTYEQVTAQAYRTTNPAESFVAEGVGLVIPVPDYDRVTIGISVPATAGLLV